VVVFRVDMHLVGSLFDVFRLQRIELNEAKDCLKLNAFFVHRAEFAGFIDISY